MPQLSYMKWRVGVNGEYKREKTAGIQEKKGIFKMVRSDQKST